MGATIRYTVTGIEPTIYDPVVVSGQSVWIAKNMTLKAKAFNGSATSNTASTTFDLTGDVAAGSSSLTAMMTNGQVYAWGNQASGRLANGSTATANILAPALAKFSAISSITTASRIASGANHGLMLDAAGNVWGFGANSFGEAGNSSTATTTPYALKVVKSATLTDYLTGCTKVAAGADFSAALESTGFVWTWGNQVNGRLANGSIATGSRKFANRAKSSSTLDLSGIRDIALGKDFALAREACSLETPAALGKLWVWGYNASGNLATGTTTSQAYAVNAKLNSTTLLTDAWDIDAGDDFAAVVRWKAGDTALQGSVWTFGSRVGSRLGDNAAVTGTATYPVQVQKLVGTVYSQLSGITQISCGPGHTLALDNLGNVWAWGSNATGALGDNTTTNRKYALKVRNPGNTGDLASIVRVSAGGINGSPAFSSAVAKDGSIYVWGSNANGLLANGTTSTTVFAKLPVLVTQLKTIPGFPSVSLAATLTTPNAPGATTLTATVADPQGSATISKTEFFVQGLLSSTRTASPWTATLSGLAQGIYSAYAKTTDVDGNETTSLATSFTIAPPADADGDGLLDSWETQHFGNLAQTAGADPDGDKISNLNEFNGGTHPNSAADGNADGIPDDWVVWNLAQTTGVAASSLPASGDPDLDEITNLAEYQAGTNPRLLDTDSDGQSDWQELAQGTDAKNAASLGTALEVSGYQGLTNLSVPQSLGNPVPAATYALALSGNIPPTAAYEIGSSSQAGGPAYEWLDISATGEHLMAFETDAYALVQRPIGFAFPFYGTSYANLYISGQGFVRLTDPGGSSPGFPIEFKAPLPNAAGHKPLISPYEQYLEPQVQGDIYYKAFAGYTVVQWEQVKINGFDSRPTFQAVIYADGSIRFNYKSIPLTSANQWIWGYLSGIQNAAGDQGIAASWATTGQQGLMLHDLAPVSVRFAPPAAGAPWVTASAATLSGVPLSWNLVFQGNSLGLGLHQAQLELRKPGGPLLYARTLKLTLTQNPDADNDGLPDAWENQYFGNLNQTAGGDPDGDKVTNLHEYQVATNPNSAVDANSDGIPDDWAVWQLSLPGGVAAASLPATGDPDQDELTTLAEFQNGTNPRLLDTDADGQSDWQELALGTDPKIASPQAAALEVSANQGAADLILPQSLTDPVLAADYALSLIGNGGANPWVTASTAALSGNPLAWNLVFRGQAAGLSLGLHEAVLELRKSGGPVLYSRAIKFTLNENLDSDDDGLLDSWETTHFGNLTQTGSADPDGDTVSNLNELTAGTNPNANGDSNTDGLPDDWVTWQLSRPGGVAAASLPATGDPDQDELTTLAEFQNGTNPRLLDTDADGQSDWQELSQGTDAKSAASLGAALEVSAYQGVVGLTVPQALGNAAPGNTYALSLTGGNMPPGVDYTMVPSSQAGGPAYEWIDISATGEHLMAFETNKDAMVQRAIGFSFPFYGTSYSNLYISGQGFVRLTDPGGSSPGFPVEFKAPLPNPAGHKPLIAPYEQYLEPHVLGDIYYQSFAGYTVVQWEQVKIYSFDSRPTFQAVIHADGSIRFNYKSIPLTSSGFWISGYLSGIQNAAGNSGLAASWFTTSQQGLMLHSLAPVSLRFAPPAAGAPWVTASTTTVSGIPLAWNLAFRDPGLALGLHEASLELRKAGGPVLYSRQIKLTLNANPDDGDGLPGAWETAHGLDPADNGSIDPNNGASGDPDGDQVTNLQEYQAGTHPNVNADSNTDGMPDDWVTWQLSRPAGVVTASLPATGDPDQDELTNLAEFQAGTNPRLLDTDVDGQSDWQELAQGTDAKNALSLAQAPIEASTPLNAVDLVVPQSLSNPVPAASYTLGLVGNGGANPWVTASTGLLSGNPLAWNLVFHGRAAGLAMGLHEAVLELRKAGGPVLYSRVIQLTVTTSLDQDSDGLTDTWEMAQFGNLAQTGTGDPDGDSVTNVNELAAGTNPNANADLNTDGLPDDWVTWQLSRSGGVAAASLPPAGDPDQDELTNLAEFQNGTNPRLLDTDADGQSDWQELAQGTDSGDDSSFVAPLEVAAHQGTTNLHLAQTLPNPTPANSYQLSLVGNVPATAPYELTSSKVAGGPAYEWLDISTTGEHLMAFEGDKYALVQRPVGFSFPFYGTPYANLHISGQGFLRLTDPGGSFPGNPLEFRAALPNADGHKPLIAPYEQYLEPQVQGDVYYQAFPTYTVVQWEQVKIYGYDSKPTFQAVIYADGSIRFNYKSIPLTSANQWSPGYLSGIQNAAGDQGIAASYYVGSQHGMMLHDLAPVSLRFAAPTAAPAPWVTTPAVTLAGAPLAWQLDFQASGLPPGNHDALLQFRKDAGGPPLYSRVIRLNVLPLATAGNDLLDGTPADDSLSGLDGDDTLNGNSGNDTLNGGAGNDVIRGGPGDDIVDGDVGKDAYHYNLGDGNDVITDYMGVLDANDSTADYSDLYFGAGITPGMVRSSYLTSDSGMAVTMKFEVLSASPGSVTITRWNIYGIGTNVFTSSRWRFHFQDGTIWDGTRFGYLYPHLYAGFTGGVNNDVLLGTGLAESLRGLAGDDLLQGGLGSDSYFYQWGDGNDVIRDAPRAGESPAASLTIYGGELADQLTFDYVAPDHLRINVGNPSAPAKNGSVLIEGWYQKQPVIARHYWKIWATNASGTLSNISDLLSRISTNGPDVIFLSSVHTANGQSFDGGLGDDTITGSNWSETIMGNLGNDVLSGGEGDDTLVGGTGDDDLQGGRGGDVYKWNLGDGNDTISDDTFEVVSTIENKLVFGPGITPAQIQLIPGSNKELRCSIRDGGDVEIGSVTIKNWYAMVTGGGKHAANWRIAFTGDPTIWDGRTQSTDGSDSLTGASGNDTLSGGLGNDVLRGLEGDDSLSGQEGDDTLSGGAGEDTLLGSAGADTLDGGDGADALNAGTGNDNVLGGKGSDNYYWTVGDGNDTLIENLSLDVPGEINTIFFGGEVAPGVAISSQYVKITSVGPDYGFFTVIDPSGNRIAVITVRNWSETKGKWLVSFPQDQEPSGWSVLAELTVPDLDGIYDGDPVGGIGGVASGSAYDDFISGGSSDDVIGGGDGDDQISGLAGNDTISGGDGSDIVSGGDGNDKLSGDDGSDMIQGGSGDDLINGGNGDDILSGGEGDDFMEGGEGDDTIVGQAGSDVLQGGGGNDSIEGGPGDDYLSGGMGSDTYRWNLGDGHDTIHDTSGDSEENPDENVVILGAGIELNQIRQEFVPAVGNSPAYLKVTILDEQKQAVGSFAAPFTYSSDQVSQLGLVVRTHTGNNVILVTPGRDVLKLFGTKYVVDAMGGDDEIRFVNGSLYDREYTVKGGEGDDAIFCIGAKNWITGGPGNDLISLRQRGTNHYGNIIYWNIGDGHDRIVRDPADVKDYSATCSIVLGPGISTTDCTLEVIEGLPNGSAALKLSIHDAQKQVIGSIRVDGVLAVSESLHNWAGVLDYCAPLSLSEDVSLGRWKSYSPPGSDYSDYCEFAYLNPEIHFADTRIWGPLNAMSVYDSRGTGLSDIDGDDMDDQWEIFHGMDPLRNSHLHGYWVGYDNPTETPADNDGISSRLEYALRKNPVVPDAVTPLVFETTGNDHDIMSIAYENLNGLSNSVDDSMDDKDGDGIPNVWEYVRGTRSDNANEIPAPDYIVDPSAGASSNTDNIVSTVGEAAFLANLKGYAMYSFEGYTQLHKNSIIEVRAGTYLESVWFGTSVLLYGKAGTNNQPPVILGPDDGQTLTFPTENTSEVGSMISGIRISHLPGKRGGAIVSEDKLHLRNVIIDHNVSDLGSAIYGRVDSIDHCTIFNNVSPGGVYFAYKDLGVRITNSILWGNSDPALVSNGYYVADYRFEKYGSNGPIDYTVENSIIQGGFMGATNLDPQLHRSGTLKSTSPAIDAIVAPVVSLPTRDIHGEDRSADGAPDIGADEYRDNNGTADSDGIPDWVEAATDADLLSSMAEYTTHLTDPYLADTDFDGLSDDAEVLTHLTDPLVRDTDGDGINDGNEIRIGTSPIVANNDGDSLPDEWEFDHGLSPISNDSALDLDGDGLTNAQEHAMGTDPGKKDTDGDGMADGWEVANSKDPLAFTETPLTIVADEDADGMTYWAEVAFGSSNQQPDTDFDGLSDSIEFSAGTSPTLPDSDGDGIQDIDEDSDCDGLTNRQELEVHLTSPFSKDTDADGVDDALEIAQQMNPNDSSDGQTDGDHDGLTRSKELAIGTNPSLADSDQDGVSDGLEYSGGLNPLLADSDSDGVTDLDEDTDGDGLTNRVEFGQSTHMLYKDTDMDGTNDQLKN